MERSVLSSKVARIRRQAFVALSAAMTASDLSNKYQRFFQYFWDPEPRNDDASGQDIWCLGQRYPNVARTQCTSESSPNRHGDNDADKDSTEHSAGAPQTSPDASADPPWPADFLDDFEARFWMTYRNEFPPIARSTDAALTLSVRLRNLGETSGFTSDTGWGCMIRSGQSLLSNALATLLLGRTWRRGQNVDAEKNLVALFADDPRTPFSIHRFVQHGAAACGKHPGEWFGPSATAQCIQELVRQTPDTGLQVYIAADGAQVYEGSLLKTAERQGAFKPILLLAGIRLGIDRVTPVYRQALQSVLRLKQSVGIAGGRPSASHYFVAVQGDNFFYLDPHHPRPALGLPQDPKQYLDEEISSCHTRRLRRLNIEKMDPSMLVGFLIQDREDWEDWKLAVKSLPGTSILHVAPGEPPGDTTLEREDAVDEVEAFDTEASDEEPELVDKPGE